MQCMQEKVLWQALPERQLQITEVEVDSWQCDNGEGHHHQRLEALVHGHGGVDAEYEDEDVDELVVEEIQKDKRGGHAEDEEDDLKQRHVVGGLFFLVMNVLKKKL